MFDWAQVPNVFARYEAGIGTTQPVGQDVEILTLTDLAGSNNLSAVAGERPFLVTINGQSFAKFDGTNDKMTVTFTEGAQAFPHTVYIVVQFDAPTDNLAHTVMDSVGGTNDNRLFVRKTTTNQRRVQGGATENLTFGSPAEVSSNVEVWTLIHNGGPLLSCGLVDGTKTVGDMGTNSVDSLTLGMFRDGTSNPFQGSIGEIAFINGRVSSYHHSRIGRHLAHKYQRPWTFDVIPTTTGT